MAETFEKPAAPNPEADARALRAARTLVLIVMLCGAVLMGVEIVGARVLAPSFGSSVFVWGGLIGLLMAAMALGYYIGGRWADRNPSFTNLAWVIGLAGAAVFVVPYVGNGVCRDIARVVSHRTLGPLAAAAALFFIPSFLLAMVSPFAVKLSATSLARVGGIAGRLYALSTFGSIAGTLLTTFLFIPWFKVANILCGLGVITMAVSAWGLARFEGSTRGLKGIPREIAALLALLALAGLETWIVFPSQPFIPDKYRLVEYEESSYHEVAVVEEIFDGPNGRLQPTDEIRRWLTFDMQRAIMQGGVYPYRGVYSNAMTFSQIVHLSLEWVPEPKRMLVIGSGVAVVPAEFQLHYPSIEHVDVLEIDDVVVKLAKKYFQPDIPNSKVAFHVGDGRTNLKLLEGNYDIILLDAYSSASQIPYHLLTWEFFHEAKQKLAPGGIVVSNIRSALRNDDPDQMRPADILFSAVKTMRSNRAEAERLANPTTADREPLFKQVYLFPRIWTGTNLREEIYEIRNVIVFCTDEASPREHEEIVRQAEFLTLGHDPKVKIENRVFVRNAKNQYREGPTEADLQDVPILTDDYVPVDTMYLGIKHDQ
ncbi:MAG: fused MFS/spermidine synthase [Planctomycetes bacterium]|nr:fused MFS/spermidine synthase [Planctomycetota bacterium]